jgi:predicted nucleic acid-binding protein
MRYLLDTNIVSEISKRTPNSGVLTWFDAAEDTDLSISVITIGEIRKGIEQKRRTDPGRAERLERTLNTIRTDYRGRIIAVSEEVAEEWGRMCMVYPNHPVDNLLSATAKIHGMTLVTRNIRDVEIHDISCFNPFI